MLNRKAQSTLEYAIIIAVVVGALVAMQVYIKRGLQGRLKQAADDMGEQFTAQYSTANYSTQTNTTTTENSIGGSNPVVYSNTTQNQTRNATENVQSLENEYWGPSATTPGTPATPGTDG